MRRKIGVESRNYVETMQFVSGTGNSANKIGKYIFNEDFFNNVQIIRYPF